MHPVGERRSSRVIRRQAHPGRVLPIRALLLLALFALASAPRLSAQDRSGSSDLIVLGTPKVHPDSAANRQLVDTVLRWAASRSNDLYARHFRIADPQSAAQGDYTLEVLANFDGEDSAIIVHLVRTRDGAEAESIPVLGRIGPENAIHLASTIFYQWSSFHGYLSHDLGEAPKYVEELPLDLISESLFATPGMLAPWSAVVKADSNLLVGTSTVCLELDRTFRLVDQPGRELYDAGEPGYGSVVAVTPAGTVFFKNLSSGKVIKWFGSGLKPQSWRIGSQFMGSFAALADGSALVTHSGMQQTLRLKQRRPEPLEFLSRENLYYSALSAGPEGNIWIYSVAGRRVRIYTPEGQLVDSVVPLDPDKRVPTQMAVYPDGSFLFFAGGWLYRFRRDGSPIWRTDQLLGPDEFATLNNAWVAPDPESGLIYLTDVQGRRIVKLLDRGYAAELGIRNQTEEQLLRSNQRLFRNPDDVQALADKALLYERSGSIEMARSMWQKVLEIDPASAQAREKLDRIELAALLARAAELERKTRTTIESLGPESARVPYTQTMQLYEQILQADPGNREILEKRRQLKLLFDESQRLITITAANVEDLFPSLMQRYRVQPVGSVSVRNVLDEEVRNLKAGLFIEGYMDFPAYSQPLASLAPGRRATLELKVLFNTRIFDLQEDLPLQAKIEVRYSSSTGEQSTSTVETLTLYRKTALVWDESAKLASFIMPNEETVSTFAHRVSDTAAVDARFRLSSRLFRGIRVCDALGSYGITYIEDPDSPISRVLGKAAVVDTVRFPRTTLLIRSGDCDDTTALLGSLLESVGIATAIMTTPGHVFLAFDTGEPRENLWLFTHGNLQAISHGGTIWLPVETTILEEGFLRAWEEASALIGRHRRTVEFLPVQDQRDRYPPLPLPATELKLIEPLEREIAPLFSGSVAGLEEVLYGESLKLLEDRLGSRRGADALRTRNRIGVLHARFGKDREAQQVLSDCIAEDPDFMAAYLNLANLKLERGELDEAVRVAESGLRRDPDSTLLNLLLAVCHSRKGQPARASAYLDTVRSTSPQLARRYSYLADPAAAQARASGGGEAEDALIWDPGE